MTAFITGASGIGTGAHLDARVWDPKAKSYIDPNPYLDLIESKGKRVREAFPITSPHGMRTHPVHGDQRMHWGVDFGTPAGTPVTLRGGRLLRSWYDEGGGGNVASYGFRTPDGRDLEMRFFHGDQAVLGLKPDPAPSLGSPSAAQALLAQVAASDEQQAAAPAAPVVPDWIKAASDPNREIDPTKGAYWQRADVADWSAANPELAGAAAMRFRPMDRGALGGTRVGGVS